MDELATLVGPDVEAAGWHYQIGDAGSGNVRYCKEINGMAARLDVTSLPDGTADHLATFIVLIDGHPSNSDC
ncbi:MAG: hypothetical protein WA890_04330 [Micromonospora sp.]